MRRFLAPQAGRSDLMAAVCYCVIIWVQLRGGRGVEGCGKIHPLPLSLPCLMSIRRNIAAHFDSETKFIFGGRSYAAVPPKYSIRMNGELPRSYREDRMITRSNQANHILSIHTFILLNFLVSICIWLHQLVSTCIYLYLLVSTCIYLYLLVSTCIYLYLVSRCFMSI